MHASERRLHLLAEEADSEDGCRGQNRTWEKEREELSVTATGGGLGREEAAAAANCERGGEGERETARS